MKSIKEALDEYKTEQKEALLRTFCRIQKEHMHSQRREERRNNPTQPNKMEPK